MQIKEPKGGRPGYIQIVRSAYDKAIGRGRQTVVGSMTVFKPVPLDLWEKLESGERTELAAYIGRRLAELNLSGVRQFAEDLPAKLVELAGAWPALVEDLGDEKAGELAAAIARQFKVVGKALKASIPPSAVK